MKLKNERMSKQFNKTTRNLKQLEVGDKCLYKRLKSDSTWSFGKITEKFPNRSYIIGDENGRKYWRNRYLIKLNKSNEPTNQCKQPVEKINQRMSKRTIRVQNRINL